MRVSYLIDQKCYTKSNITIAIMTFKGFDDLSKDSLTPLFHQKREDVNYSLICYRSIPSEYVLFVLSERKATACNINIEV